MTVEATLRHLVDERSDDAFLLYGSYARGDYDATSDLDILRVGRVRAPRKLDGRISLHTYDATDLMQMAERGSLFVLHLIEEAKPLHDPCGILQSLSIAFRRPHSYTCDARRNLLPASKLLDIDRRLFESARNPFISASVFFCRTMLYAEHADRGPLSFSMRALAKTDPLAGMISRINRQAASYSEFCSVREVVRAKLGLPGSHRVASSIADLAHRGQGSSLFKTLLRRVIAGLPVGIYDATPAIALKQRGSSAICALSGARS